MLSEDPNSLTHTLRGCVCHLQLWLKGRPECAQLLGASQSHMMPDPRGNTCPRCAGSLWARCYSVRDWKGGHKELTTGQVLATLL